MEHTIHHEAYCSTASTCATNSDVSEKASHKNTEKRTKTVSFKDPAVNPMINSKASSRPMPAAPKPRKPMVRKTTRMKSTCTNGVKQNGTCTGTIAQIDVAAEARDDDTEHTNVYAHPELNTVLRLAERIQTLEMEEFDGKAAVEAHLADTKSSKREVEKAALRTLNIGRDEEIFGGVLHLSFDEEALLRAAAEEREAKAKAVLPAPRPRDPEPRLDDLRVEDAIQPEFAGFPEFRLDDLDFGQLMTAPRSSSYNLYTHQRMWNGFSS